MALLDSLARGFRAAYLDHAELTAQLKAWHAAFPDLTRLTSLGTTPEGRELWLLTIGVDPDRVRPTAWVDGNMHASELAGSSVALAIAEDFLAVHVDPARLDLSPAVLARLREVRLFVLPRMSPDGAEAVLTTGRFVRSVPRDDRAERGASRWRTGDIDGDGLSLVMRVADPTGDYVAPHADHPDLLSARQLDDDGPAYRVYPEGMIDHWDGFTIPAPSFVGDNPVDLNRNFPWSWAPTHEQIGAGRFPLSEPESRAVVEFTAHHPEIFAWLNLHCYGGVFIRPLGHAPDSKMDQGDLAVFRQLEGWAKQLTGYPTVSGFEEFLYSPDAPLHGDLTDYAYNQRGALAYVVELWDLFKRLELPTPKRFVDYYTQFDRAAAAKLAAWDRAENASRVIRPWRRFDHPQLGPVEIGGLDVRIGVWNPPPELLPTVCAQHSACFARVAALAPAVVVRSLVAVAVGDDLTRIELVVDNRGYLATYGLPSAKKLEWNEPLYAELVADGCALVEPERRRVTLGHLAGWGHGVGAGADELAYLRSAGNDASARASWLVRGRGAVAVRVGAARVGFTDATVVIE
ncbi:MAG: peptidase M14 [Kofleriaceae bacterium]|jgi:hypothetical protein|nr:peptidase M14 [Kofleriaceae bacterium]MBP9171430.1 peptidase M14 [Kofleriaceae bacterium]MBP9861611.1 peptidase M14 [Kofleriaceae bacterium]